MSLEEIREELSLEECSLEHFALDVYRGNKSKPQARPDDSLDLRDYPNADFYFKLVAKVGGKYYSIFDGDTEYQIGKPLHQPA